MERNINYLTDSNNKNFYPHSHTDAIFVDEDDTKTLTEALQELNTEEITQSDWNVTDNTSPAFIKNKPTSLLANGGNADTLDNKHADDFVLKDEFENHETDSNAHKQLLDKKLNADIANNLLKESSFNADTGVLTFTRLNGTIININIPKSLIFKSASFNEATNEIVITWSDNSQSKIPCEGLVDVYTGSENDVIQITVSDTNVISAVLKNGSITRTLLSSDIVENLDKSHEHINKDVLDKINADTLNDVNECKQHISNANIHVPTGGANGQVVGMTDNGVAWVDVQSKEGVTYELSKTGSTITLTGSDGSKTSVTDADTKYSVATSSKLGLVKSGTDITVDANGNVSVNDDSHDHVIANIDGLQSALDNKAASNHTHSSYANQNAFSNITVGSTTVSADSPTDTLTLVAGSNVNITADSSNDRITISCDTGEFFLKNVNMNFSNLTCRINDNRITADSIVDVYFDSDSYEVAKAANIYVDSYSGYLVLTASTAPTKSMSGTIKVKVV